MSRDKPIDIKHAVQRLAELHGINLTPSGLRVHVDGNSRPAVLPVLKVDRVADNVMLIEILDLDKFAEQYIALRATNRYVGHAWRRGKK